MKTLDSDFASRLFGGVLKGGTSAGARRGWETRRGRAPVSEREAVGSKIMSRAAADLKRAGVAQVGNVHVKIVPLLEAEGFGVETTVAGDRRYPREPGMTLEQARVFALEQLRRPRPTQMVQPPPEPAQPEKPDAQGRPAEKPYKNPGDLAAEYKRRGMDRNRAWDQFVIDTILTPRYRSEAVNAREFFLAYERA